MKRTPHGYFDRRRDRARSRSRGLRCDAALRHDRATQPRVIRADVAAVAYCQGTPLAQRDRIACGGASLDEATSACARAIAARFGSGAVDGKIQAHVIVVTR